jgi:hypothetical protein
VDSTLVLSVTERGADAIEMEHASGLPRDELVALDAGTVTRPHGDSPAPGARGGDASVAGALLVALPPAHPC